MLVRALTWNVFHGRDFPPDPSLRSRRSRLLRVTESNDTHAGVNRDLSAEFMRLIAGASWDVALLQECPPHWAGPLTRACDAHAHRCLTSRNSCRLLRRAAAALNPDLVGSDEGGSNLTLIRRALGSPVDRRELVLSGADAPERRAMAFTRLITAGGELCVANLHASAGPAQRTRAETELRLAAERSREWCAGTPLLLGGDLNLRPRTTAVYAELAERFGLAAPTGEGSLDHLLVHGLEVVEPPAPWPAEAREIPGGEGLRVRLSDHAPVGASFRIGAP